MANITGDPAREVISFREIRIIQFKSPLTTVGELIGKVRGIAPTDDQTPIYLSEPGQLQAVLANHGLAGMRVLGQADFEMPRAYGENQIIPTGQPGAYGASTAQANATAVRNNIDPAFSDLTRADLPEPMQVQTGRSQSLPARKRAPTRNCKNRSKIEQNPHHAGLEICTKPNGELMTVQEILAPHNGISVDQLYGSPILYMSLCGIPMNKFSELFNEKRRAEGSTGVELVCENSRAINKRVEGAIKHKFGVFDRKTYRVRRKELSEAHKKNNVVARAAYIAMLRDPATDLINPKAGCCLKDNDKETSSEGESEDEQQAPSDQRLAPYDSVEDDIWGDGLVDEQIIPGPYSSSSDDGSHKCVDLEDDTAAVQPGVQTSKNPAKRARGKQPATDSERFVNAEQQDISDWNSMEYAPNHVFNPLGGPQHMTPADSTNSAFSNVTFLADPFTYEPAVEQNIDMPIVFDPLDSYEPGFGAGFDEAAGLADENGGDFDFNFLL